MRYLEHFSAVAALAPTKSSDSVVPWQLPQTVAEIDVMIYLHRNSGNEADLTGETSLRCSIVFWLKSVWAITVDSDRPDTMCRHKFRQHWIVVWRNQAITWHNPHYMSMIAHFIQNAHIYIYIYMTGINQTINSSDWYETIYTNITGKESKAT